MRVATTNSVRSHIPAVAVLLVIFAVLAGCAPDLGDQPGAESSTRPAPAIPHPALDAMDPDVARALEGRRSALEALLERNDVTGGEQARALGELGGLYQAHRLVEAAEACYREAHLLAPETFEWAYLYGVLTARQGNLDEAVVAFEKAIVLRPRDLPATIRLADLELDRGHVARAGRLYESAVSLDPSMAAAEFGLGRVAAHERSYLEAIEHFEKALNLQPRASVIRYHLGQAYRQLGQLEEAERQLAQSGPVKVAIADPLMSAINALVETASPFLIQGNTALRDGRLTVAANAFRRAVEADPENRMARQSLATVLTLLQDSEGALEQLQAAVRVAPDNAQVQADLGTALAEQGIDQQALDHLFRAVALEPELQRARFNLANLLARMGRLEEAESHYRRLLEIDPSDLAARSRLGTVLAQAGKLQAAIVELDRVVEQDPENAEAHLNLARLHFNLGTVSLGEKDPSSALRHFERALDYDDRLAPAHLNVANLLAGSGRLAEALPHFARVSELEPDHKTARLGRATALMHLKRFPEAKTVLEEAVRLLPDEIPVAHALARLLAGAPEPALRDGRRALALMVPVLESATVPSYVETQAMALAEVGRLEEAVGRQRSLLAELRRLGRTADAERAEKNLARYERGMACCADSLDALPR